MTTRATLEEVPLHVRLEAARRVITREHDMPVDERYALVHLALTTPVQLRPVDRVPRAEARRRAIEWAAKGRRQVDIAEELGWSRSSIADWLGQECRAARQPVGAA